MKADFNINFDDVVQEPVLYGDFVAHTADKAYQELDDLTLVNNKFDFKFSIFIYLFFLFR
jgi:hypothetical protein